MLLYQCIILSGGGLFYILFLLVHFHLNTHTPNFMLSSVINSIDHFYLILIFKFVILDGTHIYIITSGIIYYLCFIILTLLIIILNHNFFRVRFWIFCLTTAMKIKIISIIGVHNITFELILISYYMIRD